MPRFSTTIYDASGRPIGIACGSRRQPKCSHCNAQLGTGLECDGCDKPLCHACAVSPKKGVDLCPRCFEPAWKHWLKHYDLTCGRADLASRTERRAAFRAWARAEADAFLRLVKLSAEGQRRLARGPQKSPRELWLEAGGRIEDGKVVAECDREKFRALMTEHGHVVLKE